MWIELTERSTNQTVLVNTNLVTHVTKSPEGAASGRRLFFSNSAEIVVAELLEQVTPHLIEMRLSSATMT